MRLALALALLVATAASADAGRRVAIRPSAKVKRAPKRVAAPRLTRKRPARIARAPRKLATFVYDPASRMVRGAALGRGPEPWRRMPLGATYLGDGQTSFVVWAPRARALEVAVLDKAGQVTRRHALTAGADGYFHGTLPVAAGARYKYALTSRKGGGVELFPDPASRHQPDGVHGPSEVTDLRFAWSGSESSFRAPKLRDHIIYQFHVGTFTGDGDLPGAAARMDEIADTGFTAAQPLPVSQFPGARNWGYDPAQLYAVQSSYGGPAGMKKWVEATHRAGMAAIVDVVYNHPGPEGNYLGAFGPYFEGKPTPWGRGMTSRGKARPHVWRYFIENALQWAAAYHVDGIRVDASHALPPAFFAELKRAADNLSRQLGRRIVVIAEDNRNQGAIVRAGVRTAGHTRGADTQWSTDPWHAWRVLHTGERGSYLDDFADDPLRLLARGVRRGWIYEGQTSPSTGKPRGTPAGRLRGDSHVLPMGDHDQYGNTPTGDRLSARVSARVQRSTDFMRYLLPVIPQVFMGDEWGTRTPFLYFVDHGDPAIREATRKGRAEEFRHFYDAAGIEAPDPTAAESRDRSVLDHREKRAPEHAGRADLTRALIALRKQHPALESGSKRSMQVTLFADQKVLAIRRWAGDRELVAVFNVGDAPATVDLGGGEVVSLEDRSREARRPLRGRYATVLHSEEKRFGGSGTRVAGFDGAAPVVSIPAHGAVYFAN
jgi:maltooligosyltrehalose trehalohydrolase